MPQSNTNTKRSDIQHIRSVEYSTARYRFVVERNPPVRFESINGNRQLKEVREAPLVFRIQVGLWCKITTGHKLDKDVSIAKKDGEIAHPCKLCRALIGTGLYTQKLVAPNEEPLVRLK